LDGIKTFDYRLVLIDGVFSKRLAPDTSGSVKERMLTQHAQSTEVNGMIVLEHVSIIACENFFFMPNR
jgi:hypothetical protein